eukprot:scaffold3985_cov185-Chaetoceros_neogracile.AAC.2
MESAVKSRYKKGGLSSGIRQDFVATDFGNRRRDGAKLIFEGPPAQVLADVPFAKDEDGAKTRRLHLVRIAPRRIIIITTEVDFKGTGQANSSLDGL